MSDELKPRFAAAAASGVSAGQPAVISTPCGDSGRGIPRWVILTGAFLFLGHLPLLVIYSINLMGREPYQFAPLAVAASLFLVWHRFRLFSGTVEPGSPRVVFALLAIAFGLLCFATIIWSPWLAFISALLTALGVVWAAGGPVLAEDLFPGALMLLLLLRPPLNLDIEFTLRLRALAALFSSCLLDQLGVVHFLSGNVVEVAGHRFFVEEACSGINSVLCVGFFSLFYTLWMCRRWWHSVVVWLASISFVLLGNVIRITAGAILIYRYGFDVVSGWRHQLFGLVLFTLYLGMVVSADVFLVLLTTRPSLSNGAFGSNQAWPVQRPVAALSGFSALISQLTQRIAPRWAMGLGIAFSVLALAQTARALVHQKPGPVNVASGLPSGTQFSIPEQIGDWQRIASDRHNISYLELRAIYSQVWIYRNGPVMAYVALDYPYAGLHDLTVCYRTQGWDLSSKPGAISDATGKQKGFFEVEMRKKPLTSGYLLYGCFTEDGQWLDQDFNALVQGRFSGSVPTSYQVQVLSSAYASFNQAEKQQIQQLFLETRQELSQQVLAQLKRKS